MNKAFNNSRAQLGFSLLEFVIAMAATLGLLVIASTLLASSFKVRGRENQRSAAIADAQRALNLMSREIANAGYGLNSNGIVTGDTSTSQIRIRSDFLSSTGSPDGSTDRPGEDVKYALVSDANGSSIVRMDLTNGTTGVIANRIDGLVIRYYNQRVTYTIDNLVNNGDITNVRNAAGATQTEVATRDLAKFVVLVLRVDLPAVGTPSSAGYQPPSETQLVSSVALRNSNLTNY
jgi:Tfp pilus assembly protein PilW